MFSKKILTIVCLLLLVVGVLALSGCADGDEEEIDTDDNDVTVDLDSEDSEDEEESDDREVFESKDEVTPKFSSLDDPIDEIEDLLEEMEDEITDETAEFSLIRYEQISVSLGEEIAALNTRISELSDDVYIDEPDLEQVSDDYYTLVDDIASFYADASTEIDDLRQTSASDEEEEEESDEETDESEEETSSEEQLEISGDCVDTDEINFYVKGQTSGIYYTGSDTPELFVDECTGINNDEVYDYYCEDNEVMRSRFICPNTCSEGACIDDTVVEEAAETEE